MATFIVIACGQVLSGLGSPLTDFGLGIWIYQKSGSPTQFALSILISALPSIVVSPLAGALVDRWDRKRVMLVADTVLAVKTLAVLVLLSSDALQVWHVYLLNALGSVFSRFHSIAWSASAVMLVPKQHLARVSGLRGALQSGTDIAAPALAGLLLVSIGLDGIAAVDLASWALAIVPLAILRVPSPAPSAGPGPKPSLAREVREGWLHLKSLRGLLYLLTMYSLMGFFGITTDVLRGPYVLGAVGPVAYGVVESVVGIGTVLGGVLLGVFGQAKRPIRVIIGSEFLICLAGTAIGALPRYYILLAGSFTYYAAVSYCDGTIGYLWQQGVRPEFQGRVFALRDTLTMSLMPIGVLLFSPLAEFWIEPRLMPEGAWASSIGWLIGTRKGRGIGFLFIVSGIICTVILILGLLNRTLRRADIAPAGEGPDNGRGGTDSQPGE